MATTTDNRGIPPPPGTAPGARGGGPPRGSSIPVHQREVRFSHSYGRLVSWLKVLLPTFAVALVVLVVAWPHLEEEQRRFGESLLGLDGSRAQDLEVRNAVYDGLNEGQPYTVSASVVRQAEVDSPIVELTEPKADIMLSEENWALISSLTGRMDREAQVLELFDEVNLFHDLGYEFHTKSLTIDLIGGSAYGFDPVWGQGPFGNLEAEGVRIYNRGARVELIGKSRLVIYGKRGES